MNEKILKSLRQIMESLVSGNYEALASMTQGIRLTSHEMHNAVADYGRQLVIPPENAYELADVVEVKGATPRKFSIVMPLWTKEEGRSDLSIELTFIEKGESYAVEIDDLHVL